MFRDAVGEFTVGFVGIVWVWSGALFLWEFELKVLQRLKHIRVWSCMFFLLCNVYHCMGLFEGGVPGLPG